LPGGTEISKIILCDGFTCGLFIPDRRFTSAPGDRFSYKLTRELAQSFLTDNHLQRIVAAYQAFNNEKDFAQVVSNDEIREKGNNLSIPL